jgi:phosphoenolpyruvate carboxykinase (ATP)
VGKRIDIPSTRAIIDAILDGSLLKEKFSALPVLNLMIPENVKGVAPGILNPRNLWPEKEKWDASARELAQKFIKNFETFTDTEEGLRLVTAGPQIKSV